MVTGSGLGVGHAGDQEHREDHHPAPLPEPLVGQDPGQVQHDDEQRDLERHPEGQHHRHGEAQV